MSEVVSDDMVERARAVLVERVPAAVWTPNLADVIRELVEAALNPPEDRACLCAGCPHERTGNSQFCSDPCRTKHWKDATGYVDPRYANRPNGTNGDEAGDLRPRRPGGLQVAFGPAVNAFAAYLASATPLTLREARTVAVRVLTSALSVKQRERAKRRRTAEFRAHNT